MPDANVDRLAAIKRDLTYYREAHKNMGVGGLPPTVHASKYADDVEFLLGIVFEDDPDGLVETPPTKSQLEVALEHDAAGRTERR